MLLKSQPSVLTKPWEWTSNQCGASGEEGLLTAADASLPKVNWHSKKATTSV